MTVHQLQQSDITVTLTNEERWALTKLIAVVQIEQAEVDGLAEDPEWTADVELALEAVFTKLNPNNYGQSA
jgi:hypothetical protein